MADSRTAGGNIVDEPGASCRNSKEVLWLKQINNDRSLTNKKSREKDSNLPCRITNNLHKYCTLKAG